MLRGEWAAARAHGGVWHAEPDWAASCPLGACCGGETAGCQETAGRFGSIGLGARGGLFSPAASPHDPDLMFVSSDVSGLYREHALNDKAKWVETRMARIQREAK